MQYYIVTVYYFTFSYDARDHHSGVGRYANDAWRKSDINCSMKLQVVDEKPWLFLKTTRPIRANEELRYDYGDNTAPWR